MYKTTMRKSFLYGVLLVIACSCFRHAQSTPTFAKEYVHIKLHVPVEVRHHGPVEVAHSKHVHHHHYHKRRRPVQSYHGAKHSSGPHADDYLEALIISREIKPFHHHHHHAQDDDETFLTHVDEHVEPVEETILHHEHPSIAEHDSISLDDFKYHQLYEHDNVDSGHKVHYRPQQYNENIKFLQPKKPVHKYLPTVVYEDDSNIETDSIKFQHIPIQYHQPEIEEVLESAKSHFEPSSYEGSTLQYTSHLSSDKDVHYQQKPAVEADEFLEIDAVYQPVQLKNTARNLKSHRHKEPVNVEYIHKNPTDGLHQSHAEYSPDYVDKIRQDAEFHSVEGRKEIPIYEHPENYGYDVLSSHEELFRHEDFETATDDGAVADLPFYGHRHHHGHKIYSDIDSYSNTHKEVVGGRGGYHYSSPVAKIKK